MVKRTRSIYLHSSIDYSSLVTLEGILATDYKEMSKKRFKACYTNKRWVENLLSEWYMPKKLCTGFIYAYLEYRFKDLKFPPYNFKKYVVQEDYFSEYKDNTEMAINASAEAIPCFKRHGFLYREVLE